MPLGLERRGRSRTWIDDQRWYAIVVEFQPSGFSKGSYLNPRLQRLVQANKLCARGLALILRRSRRDEGSGLECFILEGAVIPDPQLPRESQRGQCGAVIPAAAMTRLISKVSNL